MAKLFQRHAFTLRSRPLQVLFGLACLLLIVLVQRPPVLAQSGISQARVAEILDGNQVYIQSQQARVNDVATKGKRVRTGQARAQLAFNNGAVARLSSNSSLVVGQSCARLQRGTLLVNGVANGCTSSISSGVRGTTYILEVDDQGQEQVIVLEGEVTVSQRDPAEVRQEDAEMGPEPNPIKQLKPLAPPPPGKLPPLPPQAEPKILKSGQKVEVTNGQPGPIEQLSQQEFEQLLQGNLFTGFNLQIPGIDKVRESFQTLFPGVPFPIDLPSLSVPGIPGVPSIPGLPF